MLNSNYGTNFGITAGVDYNTLRYDVTVFHSGAIPYPTNIIGAWTAQSYVPAIIVNKRGTPIGKVQLYSGYPTSVPLFISSSTYIQGYDTYNYVHGRAALGLTGIKNGAFEVTTQSGRFLSSNTWARTTIEGSYSDLSYLASGLDQYPSANDFNGLTIAGDLDYNKSHYVGSPLQLIRGEGVLNALVTNASGAAITWSCPDAGTVLTDFSQALVTSISGTASGSTARVVSYDNSINRLILDYSGTWSGNLISVAPVATVTGYGGWTSISDQVTNWYVDKNIHKSISNVTGAITFDSFTVNIPAGLDLSFSTTPGAPLAAPARFCKMYFDKDIYQRNPEVGDLLRYTDIGAASRTTAVVGVQSNGATWFVWCYPGYQPAAAPNNAYTLIRSTWFDLKCYPEFDSEFTVVLPTLGSVAKTFHTPKATLAVTANQYDSAFGTVTDTSHFHIGPITLSDGSVLENNEILYSGSLYNNNPTSNSALKTWKYYGSLNPNVATTHSGQFVKHGIFVGLYDQAFTTPDMLVVKAEAGLGSAKVKATVNLTVQPPV